MREFKKQNAEETKHVHTCIKENYLGKGRGHLNHQDLYSVVIKDKVLLAFPDIETILWLINSKGF
jgi:hypothetical protein